VRVLRAPKFRRAAKKLLSEQGVEELERYLGTNPEAGDLIPGLRGVRKLRWALPGRGKRGGARVIYYYQVKEWILLFNIYSKASQADLTAAERRAIIAAMDEVKSTSSARKK